MMSTLGVILLGLLFSVIVIAYATDPRTKILEVPASRPKCQRCGRRLPFQDSKSCPNCNPTLPVGVAPETAIDPGLIQTQVPDGAPRSKQVRICLVCDLEMDPSETLTVCPHCGNVFHKEHLVQWVRLRKHCPVCGERLAEREIKVLCLGV